MRPGPPIPARVNRSTEPCSNHFKNDSSALARTTKTATGKAVTAGSHYSNGAANAHFRWHVFL